MGGFGAYNLALKYPDKFGAVIGVLPALNLRWIGGDGDYMADFDPCCWGWRTNLSDPCEVLGDFGIIKVRMKDFIYPVFGSGDEALRLSADENPIELLDKVNLQPGQLKMFIGIACLDEFNLDAQALSFVARLRDRGLRGDAEVLTFKYGRHSERTARQMFPHIVDWLSCVLAAEGIR
jgi:S-formylglutathione hydrolase FrmB